LDADNTQNLEQYTYVTHYNLQRTALNCLGAASSAIPTAGTTSSPALYSNNTPQDCKVKPSGLGVGDIAATILGGVVLLLAVLLIILTILLFKIR